MVSNFEILMDFKNVRDFAICMSKNNICCHKASCFAKAPPEKAEEECSRCWLDFLTSDEGLDLSYLEVKPKIESHIKLSKKSLEILENKKKEIRNEV